MKAEYAYIGIRDACGCCRAIVIDDPGAEADTARCVAEYIKSGLRIERVTESEGRRRICEPECDACAERMGRMQQSSLQL